MHTASAPFSPAGPGIAVVGLGFSGTATAMHLMRRLPAGARLWLFEPSLRRARGLAYSTRCASHWLNVPAGRMGWDAADDSGFLHWLRRRHGAYEAGEYVPRMLYGQYLEESLEEAERRARERGLQVLTVPQAVQDISRGAAGGWRLRADDGSRWEADAVVLASGHLAPEMPPLPAPLAWGQPGLLADPWQDEALDTLARLPQDAPLLLLGSGLTAIDIITWLQDHGHTGRIELLSRRGLMPQPQHRAREACEVPGLAEPLLADAPTSLPTLLRRLRHAAADLPADGRDWRELLASLRPHTPRLWQRLGPCQRRQFLRHLQPWWDTHRHRVAPGIQRRLDAAVAAGRLAVHAGRLEVLAREADGALCVRWRPRGAAPGPGPSRRVAAVVNCTGPSARVGHAPASAAGGLLASLAAAGRLLADPLAQGLAVDRVGRLLDAAGQPQPRLFHVGPLRKAQDWEAVAVPELRQHAALAAVVLCEELDTRGQRRPDVAAAIWS